MTHADEYNAEIPQNGNGRSTTKGKKKEKDTRNKGVRKKVKVKKEPKVIAEATITKGAGPLRYPWRNGGGVRSLFVAIYSTW